MNTKVPIRIEAIVKSKSKQIFFVFNRKVEFIHTQFDNETIIGEDEGIYNFYFYKSPSKYFQAFAG
ncbi:hypothetical protein, partial [Bacteroides ovatus]